MATQATIKAVLEIEDQEELEPSGQATLPVELDAIPGAVWQMELQGLMPADVRVSLFEKGSRKCALLRFAPGERDRAYAAFERALAGANAVSEQSHRAAAQAVERVRRDSKPAPG
jgi:hypothetical protein